MKLIQLIYQDQPIEFSTAGEETVMVNATQMAKVFKKEPKDFLRLDGTKKYISALAKSENIVADMPRYNEEFALKILNSNNKAGTFMNRKLALKFAAWLDVEFEVWIFSKIDELILGSYRKHKLATIEKLKAQEDLEQKKNELIANNPDLQEFFNMETKVTLASKKQAKAIRETVKEIQMQCFP